MRVNVFSPTSTTEVGFTSTGGTITGPLLLSGDPGADMHAVPKQYIDALMAAISASRFTTGTISATRLPAYTGDASTAAGATAVTLTSSGVTPGTYTKVTVDAKGRIYSGTTLAATDIPNLDWSKIVSGKPTTLAGYGILDAAPTNLIGLFSENIAMMSGSGGTIPSGNTVPLATEGTLSLKK